MSFAPAGPRHWSSSNDGICAQHNAAEAGGNAAGATSGGAATVRRSRQASCPQCVYVHNVSTRLLAGLAWQHTICAMTCIERRSQLLHGRDHSGHTVLKNRREATLQQLRCNVNAVGMVCLSLSNTACANAHNSWIFQPIHSMPCRVRLMRTSPLLLICIPADTCLSSLFKRLSVSATELS